MVRHATASAANAAAGMRLTSAKGPAAGKGGGASCKRKRLPPRKRRADAIP